jgi:hypothetical protein
MLPPVGEFNRQCGSLGMSATAIERQSPQHGIGS